MNANNVPIIDLKKESLINAFQNYMGRSFSNDKMLRFLSAYNATLLAMTATKKEFTKEEKETLYEFHDWFLEKYGEKTYKARMRKSVYAGSGKRTKKTGRASHFGRNQRG